MTRQVGKFINVATNFISLGDVGHDQAKNRSIQRKITVAQSFRKITVAQSLLDSKEGSNGTFPQT